MIGSAKATTMKTTKDVEEILQRLAKYRIHHKIFVAVMWQADVRCRNAAVAESQWGHTENR